MGWESFSVEGKKKKTQHFREYGGNFLKVAINIFGLEKSNSRFQKKMVQMHVWWSFCYFLKKKTILVGGHA